MSLVGLRRTRRELRDELALAARIADVGARHLKSNLAGMARRADRDLSDCNVVTSGAVFYALWRFHGAVVTSVTSGLEGPANASVRTMLETLGVLRFLLLRRVVLRQNGKRVPPVPGKPLSTRLRCDLYWLHDANERLRGATKHAKTPGLKRFARGYDTAGMQRDIDKLTASVGPVWAKRMKDAQSLQGGREWNLLHSVGLGPTKTFIYQYLSWPTHGAGVAGLLHKNAEGKVDALDLQANTARLRRPLQGASILLHAGLSLVDQRFHLGSAAELKSLEQRLRDLSARARADDASIQS